MTIGLPLGTFDWTAERGDFTVPSDVRAIRSSPGGGGGATVADIGTTWYDDLEIYQNGVLIYENKFSSWTPYIIGGVVATMVVPLVVFRKKIFHK